MTNEVCEVRLDISWNGEAGAQGFERAWKEAITGQRVKELMAPKAETLGVRYRLCGLGEYGERLSALGSYLQARLGALPGAPTVVREPETAATDWRGVRVWLTYRSCQLSDLLRRSRRSDDHPKRGRRI